jgi:integrase
MARRIRCVSTNASAPASCPRWRPAAVTCAKKAALDAIRVKDDGSPVKPATVNTYVAAVKSLLGFAHRVGFTRFNAAPLIKLKKAPRQIAARILGEIEVGMLIRAAKKGRDRLLLETAYFGGLRVSELVGLACQKSSGWFARPRRQTSRPLQKSRCTLRHTGVHYDRTTRRPPAWHVLPKRKLERAGLNYSRHRR